MTVFATIAYQCLKRDPKERPLMSDVVTALTTAFQYQCLKPPRTGSIPKVINVLTAMELKRRRSGILSVKIVEGIYVRRINPFAACNPFVTLKLSHTDLQSVHKTTVKHKESYPKWNEEFSLKVENIDVQSLHITVMSEQSVNKYDYLGRSSMESKEVSPDNPKTHNISVRTKHNGFLVCKLKLETVYKPLAYNQSLVNEYLSAMQKAAVETRDGPGLLVIIIHEARYLEKRELSCNPYVSVSFRDELRKTKTIMNDHYPEWKEKFTFTLDRPPRDDKLRLEVISTPWSRFLDKEESMGCVDIDLAHVVDEERIIDTYKLKGLGMLEVELQWRISNHITPNNDT
ncbi:hypothetical protein QVD17_21179 [Tagetes erecta]|uniref:C2 domain-containing protein n=1 Tax=Tagetes erecta TaxID=13708 RepID=A0AAD8KN20_TARER|nr:hypothetical protein QVD17_21179 [Tagetes erecta]